MRDSQNPHELSGWFAFEQSAAILLFIAIGFVACLMPAQNDTWWHLRAGEETWRAGGVQLRDSFSHTVSGAYWPNLEWLSEVLFYGIYRAGGLPLLTAFVAGLVLLSWTIVWRLTPGRLLWRVGLVAVALASSAPEWSLRPKVLTLFLLPLTTWLLARGRYVWLPPIFLLWGNLHGGFLLGLVVLLSVTAVAAISERKLWTPLTWTSLGCIGATCFTPLGLSLWVEIPVSLQRIRQYDIQEWRPPAFGDPVFLPFWIVTAALIALTVFTRPWRSRNPERDLVLCGSLALLPLALGASRNVSAMLLLAVPAVGALVEPLLPPVRARVARERPLLNAAMVVAFAIGAMGGVARSWNSEAPRLAWHPVSPGVLRAVEECPEPLYNRYDDGGYLIWFAPARKVFIDSRQDPYPPEMMHEHVRMERSGDYESTFRKFSIGCAFLPTEALVADRLRAARWHTLYEDRTWTVLRQPVER